MTPSNSNVVEAVEPSKKSSITAADPCTIVIFGASGDLSRRKLVPALYSLAAQNCLARRFAIIGFARTPMTDEAFQDSAIDSVKNSPIRARAPRLSARNSRRPSRMFPANITTPKRLKAEDTPRRT